MKFWLLVAAALILASCTAQESPSSTSRQGIFDRFMQHMAGCTQRYGYDPDTAADLGPNELGTNEREWSTCVYDGIERILAVNSPLPKAYSALIEEHKDMTDKVASGQMTRDQRSKQIAAVFESIRRDEEALLDQKAQASRSQADRDALREIERIRRDIDRTRRSLIGSM